MADVFWTPTTPGVASSSFSTAYVATRVAGAALDGSQDTFAQVAIAAIVAYAVAQISTGQIPFTGLPDLANGGAMPAVGSGLPYLKAGVLCIA
jgi:hypothetical protein